MKAEKGDLIRVVDAAVNGDKYKNGDILEVVECFDSGVDVSLKLLSGDNVHVWHEEYEIHRKACEEATCDYCGKTGVHTCRGGEKAADAVNPTHYKQGRIEVIDVIEDAVQDAGPFEAVCLANVLKYSLRYRHKNGVEDLKKAAWYLDRMITHLEKEEE